MRVEGTSTLTAAEPGRLPLDRPWGPFGLAVWGGWDNGQRTKREQVQCYSVNINREASYGREESHGVGMGIWAHMLPAY
jgi:hypothetical protein